MMMMLYFGGMHQALMIVQDRFGKAGRAGREIDGRVVMVIDGDGGRLAGAVCGAGDIVFREAGAGSAHIKQQAVLADALGDLFDAADKFRSEDEHVGLRQVDAVFDLFRGIAEIERYGDGAGLQDAKIDRQPFQAVHQQDGHFVPFAHAAAEQQVGKAVGFFIEYVPGDLPAVIWSWRRFDQLIFFPGDAAGVAHLRVDFHKTDVVSIQSAVAFQNICDRHDQIPPTLKDTSALLSAKVKYTPFCKRCQSYWEKSRRKTGESLQETTLTAGCP